jgi:hypothetical protein
LGVAEALLRLIDDELHRRARYPRYRRQLCATGSSQSQQLKDAERTS